MREAAKKIEKALKEDDIDQVRVAQKQTELVVRLEQARKTLQEELCVEDVSLDLDLVAKLQHSNPNFGYIKSARNALHMSLRALAEKSGISASSLNRIERGQQWAASETLDKIFGVIGFPQTGGEGVPEVGSHS